jgi:hypothetical protein
MKLVLSSIKLQQGNQNFCKKYCISVLHMASKHLKLKNAKLWFNVSDIIISETSIVGEDPVASASYTFSFPLYATPEPCSNSIGVHEVKVFLLYDAHAKDSAKPYLRTVDHLVYLYKQQITLKFSTFSYVADTEKTYPSGFKFKTLAGINDAKNNYTGYSANIVLTRPIESPNWLLIDVKNTESSNCFFY